MGHPEDGLELPPSAAPRESAEPPDRPEPAHQPSPNADSASAPPALRTEDASQAMAPARQNAPSEDASAQVPPPGEASAASDPAASAATGAARKVYFIARHSMAVRTTHWLNTVILATMLASGLQIFNAHPALYWGARSDFERPLLALKAETAEDGTLVGVTTLFGYRVKTTGILGVSNYRGEPEARGFPAWITLPGARWLSMGRTWHFFFAWLFVLNGLAYIAYALVRRHIERDLLPTRDELCHIGRTIWDHARLRFHKGEAARRYNVLQKLAYLGVVFVLGPLVVLTGLSMSPTVDAAFPWLPELFGGRQSARTIHFLCAVGFVGFFLIHVFMVLVSGVWNNIRSMITGQYAIDATGGGDDH